MHANMVIDTCPALCCSTIYNNSCVLDQGILRKETLPLFPECFAVPGNSGARAQRQKANHSALGNASWWRLEIQARTLPEAASRCVGRHTLAWHSQAEGRGQRRRAKMRRLECRSRDTLRKAAKDSDTNRGLSRSRCRRGA